MINTQSNLLFLEKLYCENGLAITTSLVQYLIYPYNCLEGEMFSEFGIYVVFSFLFFLMMFFCIQFVNCLIKMGLFLN